jgi:hypothetical protein
MIIVHLISSHMLLKFTRYMVIGEPKFWLVFTMKIVANLVDSCIYSTHNLGLNTTNAIRIKAAIDI